MELTQFTQNNPLYMKRLLKSWQLNQHLFFFFFSENISVLDRFGCGWFQSAWCQPAVWSGGAEFERTREWIARSETCELSRLFHSLQSSCTALLPAISTVQGDCERVYAPQAVVYNLSQFPREDPMTDKFPVVRPGSHYRNVDLSIGFIRVHLRFPSGTYW